MRNRALLIGSLLFLTMSLWACGGDFPAPNPTPPDAPGENDPDYTVRALGEWYLIGDAATPSQDLVTVLVDAPSGTDFIDVWIADRPVVRLTVQPDGSFGTQVDIAGLPVGAHEVLLAANGSDTAFAKATIKRSAAYYVLVSTDWDFADPGDMVIAYQDAMHRDHPELRITHFPGPYTFTDPQMQAPRKARLVEWLVAQRETFRDEIGLHIHPYCHFVQSAGVTCVTDQSTTMATDPTGYTIKLGAYNRTDMGTLLEHASDLFEQNGLNRPKTFRAGGWTATLETLAALSDKGFTADTSALNWMKIEEWAGRELFAFNMSNWGPITDTSQPYRPSMTDHLSSTPPTLSILEVPDNGVMIDYVTLDEMNALFDANWNGDPLAAPVTLMMGFHPAPGFTKFEYQRVEGFLDYADLRLASRHLGPVVYITLADLVPVYTP